MKNSPQEIPGRVFDWLETQDFQSLSAEQQATVLAFFSPEEYDELHHTTRRLKEVATAGTSSGFQQRKSDMLEYFDRKHTPKQTNVVRLSAVVWWRAAAVVLLLVCAALSYTLIQRPGGERLVAEKEIDTLYVVKEVASAPVKLYDTVYIRLAERQKPSPRKPETLLANHTPEPVETSTRFFMEAPPVLSLQALGNASNQPKHNSMKDDSLLRRYSVVAL